MQLFVLLPGTCLAARGWLRHSSDSAFKTLIQQHCADCHDTVKKTGDLDLSTLVTHDIAKYGLVWEKVLRQIDARQMPPIGEHRPTSTEYESISSYLAAKLDTAAAANPNPGRVDTFRRLNRTEYQNAIRDLLALEIDMSSLLPADESSHGFDHITVGDLSPALLTRYIQAAQKLSQLAVGAPLKHADGVTLPHQARHDARRACARVAAGDSRRRFVSAYLPACWGMRDSDSADA